MIEWEETWEASSEMFAFIAMSIIFFLIIFYIGYKLTMITRTWKPTSSSTAAPIIIRRDGQAEYQQLSDGIHADDDNDEGDLLRATLVRQFLLAKAHVLMMQVTGCLPPTMYN
jgi:hypothetical protein